MAYKNTFEAGMFDQEFTIEALSGMGNPLSALKEVLDFEQFRPILEPLAPFRSISVAGHTTVADHSSGYLCIRDIFSGLYIFSTLQTTRLRER